MTLLNLFSIFYPKKFSLFLIQSYVTLFILGFESFKLSLYISGNSSNGDEPVDSFCINKILNIS